VVLLIIAVFGLVYAGRAVLLRENVPLMVLGLWALGTLNILSGVMVSLMDEPLGIFPIMVGVISIELGEITYGYWKGTPNWNWHALRISLEVFVVGLLFI
jgi:hypothetical protein